MTTPQRAILNADNVIVEIIGLEDKWNFTPAKGLKIGPRTGDHIEVGGSWNGENYLPAPKPPLDIKTVVTEEADRRRGAGFIFKGVEYQSNTPSMEAIAKKKTDAFHVMTMDKTHESRGTQWLEDGEDFAWIASDNSPVPMTAEECYAFGLAAERYQDAISSHARTLKALTTLPEDYADDRHWPNRSLD